MSKTIEILEDILDTIAFRKQCEQNDLANNIASKDWASVLIISGLTVFTRKQRKLQK